MNEFELIERIFSQMQAAQSLPNGVEKGIGDDVKDVYLEGKAVGYDPKIMKAVIKLRAMKPDDRREMEAVLDLYKSALGIA